MLPHRCDGGTTEGALPPALARDVPSERTRRLLAGMVASTNLLGRASVHPSVTQER
jgi:hypothetical protein